MPAKGGCKKFPLPGPPQAERGGGLPAPGTQLSIVSGRKQKQFQNSFPGVTCTSSSSISLGVAWNNLKTLALLWVLRTFPDFPSSSPDATVFRALIDAAPGWFEERKALIDIHKVFAARIMVFGAT